MQVWLFFTDKGFSDPATFASLATTVKLTDRARHRRAKVGRGQVLFADLPVSDDYVSRVEALGGRLRVASRWLNAASFVIAKERLDAIASLPFVAEIKPVATYRRPLEAPVVTDEDKNLPEPSSQSGEALDYGSSAPELTQINVPAMHEQGYSGAGVTLTITDTGFRKSHNAFARHYIENRVLAEYDFVNDDGNVANEGSDPGTSWNHGTSTWSLAGGYDDGYMYGPAYRANFILCKTEDVANEYQQEEDFWVAALEFADSIGTDVITTSLGYSDWYDYSDFDGQTAVISIAAGTCDGLGIVMVNSMGNLGPGVGTLTPPADAFGILSVGAVYSNGDIAGFSSRGPTYDGRIKPDVCARGVSNYIAQAYGDGEYGTGNGTSYATPLIAGAACLLIEAHPDWTPSQVREALRLAGDKYLVPGNTYGWGVPNLALANRLTPECCSGLVGDVNGVGGDQPTLGDIARLIDHFYISLAPLDCFGEADVNLSGSLRPTDDDITMGDLSAMIGHLFIDDEPFPECVAR